MNQALYRKHFNSGEVICREGERGDCAYIIEHGRVQILKSQGGQEVPIAELGAQGLIGEMALIDDGLRSATMLAVQDSTLIVINREQLTERLRRADPILTLLLRLILGRYRAVLRSLFDQDSAAMLDGLDQQEAELGQAHEHALNDLILEQELNKALQDGQFELYFQPIVHIGTRQPSGFEALIRWNHPQRGLICPDAFLPLAEDTGLIRPIGDWVLREACAALNHFNSVQQNTIPGAPPLVMNVNVSGHQLVAPAFAATVQRVLGEQNIVADTLKVEITESALVDDPERARIALDSLRRMGVRVALDDFGTGYSGLSYLHQFPIDTIKIDRTFVWSMLDEQANMEIVRAVSGLARNLGMTVVAEGIETEEHLQCLTNMQCGFGQGYLFARPLPFAGALALIGNQVDRGVASALA